jgi:hypothetical protein
MAGRSQPRPHDGTRPAARRVCVPEAPRQRRTEAALPAADRDRRMACDHVPHRSARRQRPGPGAHARRAACRWQPARERQQDLHLRRRARPDAEHRAPGAVPPARCAHGPQGPVAGAGAQAAARRHAQRGALRAHRRKDGPARQPHLHDALRRRHRLAGRRTRPRAGRDVRDDEFGAPARGAARHRPARRGLAEGRCLCRRAPPDARARPGAREPRQRAGGPDRRASGGAPHPRHAARLDRWRAHARLPQRADARRGRARFRPQGARARAALVFASSRRC